MHDYSAFFMDSNYSHTYAALIAKLSMRLLHRQVESIWLQLLWHWNVTNTTTRRYNRL